MGYYTLLAFTPMRLKLMCLAGGPEPNCHLRRAVSVLPCQGKGKGVREPARASPLLPRGEAGFSDVSHHTRPAVGHDTGGVPMMASEPVKMFACAALAQARIEAGVPKVLIPCRWLPPTRRE